MVAACEQQVVVVVVVVSWWVGVGVWVGGWVSGGESPRSQSVWWPWSSGWGGGVARAPLPPASPPPADASSSARPPERSRTTPATLVTNAHTNARMPSQPSPPCMPAQPPSQPKRTTSGRPSTGPSPAFHPTPPHPTWLRQQAPGTRQVKLVYEEKKNKKKKRTARGPWPVWEGKERNTPALTARAPRRHPTPPPAAQRQTAGSCCPPATRVQGLGFRV